jgi:hypothetical protein
MVRQELAAGEMSGPALHSAIRAIIAAVPRDAVVSIRIAGPLTEAHWQVLSASRLRTFVPDTMNVEIRPAEGFDRPSQPTETRAEPPSPMQLSFY